MAGPWPPVLIVLAFALVATLYSINTPILEGSDEPAHFEYAQIIARGEGLPLFDLAQHGGMAYEAAQPPFYYALTALAIASIDSSDYKELVRTNPNAAYDPLALTNRNMYVHTRREDWPYTRAVLAIHAARLVSVLAGIGTIIATYGLTRTLFPTRPEAAVAASALVAFIPQFGFVSGAVSNDSLAAMMAAVTLWALANVLLPEWKATSPSRSDSRTPTNAAQERGRLLAAMARVDGLVWQAAGIGVLLGLAALTKESDLTLLPFALGLLSVVLWRRRGLRTALLAASLTALVFVLLTGWWYVVRHAALGFWFGNPDSAYSKLPPLTPADMLFQWNELEISFWGLFGWSSVPMPQPVYDGFHWFALLAITALATMLVLRRRTWQRIEYLTLAALLAWGMLVFGAYANWMRVTAQAHGRLLFPALSAFAIFLALGATQGLPRRTRRPAVAALALCLCAMSLWAAAVVIPSAYLDPQIVEASAPSAVRIDANLNNQVTLLGYEYHEPADRASTVLDVVLYWRANDALDVDYTVTVQVFDEKGERIGHLDTYPVGGMLTTRDWIVGQILKDDYPVEITPQDRAVLASVMVGLYDQATGKALQVVMPDGRRVARVTLGKVMVGS